MSPGAPPARVLVVEDSKVVRELLVFLLDREPQLQVVGTAADGEGALAAVERLRPDVITMDIHMPKMDGLEATRRIMQTRPTPIVIVSACAVQDEVTATFRAVEAGALAFVEKPGLLCVDSARWLVDTVKAMSGVRVVRRWPARSEAVRGGAGLLAPRPVSLVAIGASTGDPLVLRAILSALPRDFPAAIAIVQHISPGFAAGFADWLGRNYPVALASEGQRLLPGRAYVAPDGLHLAVRREKLGQPGVWVSLSAGEMEHGHRPSVSRLFRSVSQTLGAEAVGVLLSGMGSDGAAELKLMRDRGALTIAQSPETCVVAGMPGVAIERGAAACVLPPDGIAAALCEVVGRSGSGI